MKNKKLLSLIICLAGSLCSLAGCDNPSNDVVVDIDGELKEVTISSLYDGMVTLYQTKNYTLDIVHTSGSYREEIPSKLYTRNYIGYDGGFEDFSVLYNDGTGIYPVSFEDDFLSGEYLLDSAGAKYTNLWNNTVVNTMYGACGPYIKANVTKEITELSIKDKEYKLKFLEAIVGSTNNFVNVESLDAKYENGKVSFNLVLNNNSSAKDVYKVTLKNVGNTSSQHLKSFVRNGGTVYSPIKDFTEMRRLINMDNYVQRTYSIIDGVGTWSGFQFFTPHYYFVTGSDSMVGNAYMEFDYTDDPTLDNDFDMWGIYLVSVYKDESGQMAASLASQNAYNSSTKEVEECCFYPSSELSILKNLQYIKSGEVRDVDYQYTAEEANRYYFIDSGLVKNFVSNFSLDQGFQDVIFNTIAIEIKLDAVDKNSMICFHAIGYYAADGLTYDIIIPLYGFGDANRSALDLIYSQYNNKTN